MKRIHCILLSLFILFSSAGCGVQEGSTYSGNESSSESHIVPEEFFYRKEQLAEVEIDRVLAFALTGNGLILIGYSDGSVPNEQGHDEWVVDVRTINFDLEGHLISEAILEIPRNSINKSGPSCATIDTEGNTWLLYNIYEDSGVAVYLESYGSDGRYRKSLDPNLSDVYVQDFVVTGNNGSEVIYIYAAYADNLELGFLRAYGGEGEQLFEVGNVKGMCVLPGGRTDAQTDGRIDERADVQLIVKRELEGRITFREANKKGNLGEETLFTTDTSAPGAGAYYNSGSGYFEMVESDYEAVYGYRFNEGTRIKLLDWADQGINYSGSDLYRHIVMEGEDLYCLADSAGNGGAPEGKISLIKLARTDELPEVSNEKKVITLAALYGSSFVVDTVARFNAESQEYKIQMKTYNSDEETFILDILSGNVPDIFVFAPSMALDNYASKDLLADLYEFIDADPDISREDYVGSVLKTLETDGKLYAITPSFIVETIVGRTSDVGTGTGWTWDDFHALMAEKPPGTIPVAEVNRSISGAAFFQGMVMNRISEFVDYGADKCYFDTPEFMNLMEVSKAYYPVETNQAVSPMDYLEGNPLLMQTRLLGFGYPNTTWYESNYFGEEISYIGCPTQDGRCGSSFRFEDLIAISADSGVKEGAFQYIKYILTDVQYYGVDDSIKYGGSVGNASIILGFPVNSKAIDMMIDYYIEHNSHMNQEIDWGKRIPTEEDIRKVYDLIHSISIRSDSSVGIFQIVEEEADGFFKGQKTCSEVAEIIQNRASLLLAESN